MSITRACIACALLEPVHGSRLAQSFRVQCPTSTITHPNPNSNNSESPYTGPTTLTCSVAGGCAFANAGSSNSGYPRAPYQREWRDQVPAGLGRRRLRDDGRRHADFHVLVRAAVGPGGHRGGPARQPKFPSTLQHAVSRRRRCRVIRRRPTVRTDYASGLTSWATHRRTLPGTAPWAWPTTSRTYSPSTISARAAAAHCRPRVPPPLPP